MSFTPSTAPSAGPLDGIRIVDLTSVVLGPIATQVLADWGADVIKIESPEGDLMRSNGVSRNPKMSSIFLALNRNKRSMVLDLKKSDDAKVLRELIKTADVLVHNMRVGAIERLGFGYHAVQELNPQIVYCAATGFDQRGPDHDKPAFDDIIQAACGLVAVGSVGREVPDFVPSLIADKTAGLAVSNAITAALFHRERSGAGQYVEVPMLETMTAFTLAEHMGGMTFPGSTDKAGYARLLQGGRRPARTLDGWMGLLPYTDRHWTAFFQAAGHPELGDRYSIANAAQRNQNIQALYGHLAEILPTRTTDAWLALCQELDIPATRIYGLDELPSHPQLVAVGLFEESEHPSEGSICQIRPTTLFQATPATLRRHAPRLGEHTAEILKELGLMKPSAPPDISAQLKKDS